MVSLIQKTAFAYPLEEGLFSPDEQYPEYRFSHISKLPNEVYRSVRDLLSQLGMDRTNYGTSRWNPLGRWIKPGQKVFVLCNFVYHRRPNESLQQFQSKCTHGSVIRAVVDYLLIAVGPTGLVRVGNAPVQSCNWEQVLQDTAAQTSRGFYQRFGAPVEFCDLRLHGDGDSCDYPHSLGDNTDASSIVVDLGNLSLLSVYDSERPRYRVSDYDARQTERHHKNGSHLYILHNHILDSDVVVSIPKLKTHEKVGVTCAIKGCVGAVARKHCLAHHRKGPRECGGDEFSKDTFGVLRLLSSIDGRVQQTNPNRAAGRTLRFLLKLMRFVIRRLAPTINGAWPGNDTCWRMAVDIARLVVHVDRKGILHEEMIRPHLAFLDGVVGGEGSGPLSPSPVHTGALAFASCPVRLDEVAACLMGWDPCEYPIIREAGLVTKMPVSESVYNGARASTCSNDEPSVILNGRRMAAFELRGYVHRKYRLPPGWHKPGADRR